MNEMLLLIFKLIVHMCLVRICLAGNCKGCVQLDTYAFDKVISKFKASVVKFDVAYPYGEKHEEYVKVAEDAHNVEDLLIAEVGVKDYGEKDNTDLAERFQITKDDFPVVKLFVRGKDTPFRFTGDFSADNIKKFIRTHSGVYIGLPGCLEEFDKLAADFMKQTNPDERKVILRTTEDLWDKVKGLTNQKSAEVYVKTMRKILDSGDKFIDNEMKRIENIKKGKITKEKKSELETRINILQSFIVNNMKDEL